MSEDYLLETLYPTPEARSRAEKQLIEKYAYLMDGLKTTRDKALVAKMCENFVRTQRATGLTEDSTTANFPTSVFPTKFAFPVIAQVFPNLIANQIADVQPMTAPIGKIFYESFVNSTTGGSLTHTGSYALTAELQQVKKIRMKMDSKDVTAKKYILMAEWSTEVQEDAQAMGNIDVEATLVRQLAEEILGEIDSIVLNDMIASAAQNINYSSAIVGSETATEARNRIYQAIIDADAAVFSQRYRQTNYIVGSPQAIGRLRKMETVGIEGAVRDLTQFQIGTRYFGTFAGQWDVYSSPVVTNPNVLLLGIKGQGYVYAPYVPLELMPMLYDTNFDQWQRNMRTRAANVVTVPQDFCTVTIS